MARSQPGLYFVGLHFQTKLASSFVGGVGDDAREIADVIATASAAEATASQRRRIAAIAG